MSIPFFKIYANNFVRNAASPLVIVLSTARIHKQSDKNSAFKGAEHASQILSTIAAHFSPAYKRTVAIKSSYENSVSNTSFTN